MQICKLIIGILFLAFIVPFAKAQSTAFTVEDSVALYEKIIDCLQQDIQYNAEQKETKIVDEAVQKTMSLLSNPYDSVPTSQLNDEMIILLDSIIIFPTNKQKLQKSLDLLQSYAKEWNKIENVYALRDQIVQERFNRLDDNSVSTQITTFVSNRLIPYRNSTDWHSFKNSSIPYIRKVYERKEQQTQEILNSPTANYSMLLILLDLHK